MIAVDTSALMATALGEAQACMRVAEAEPRGLISAGILAETLRVAGRRNIAEEIAHLVDRHGFEITAVTAASARRMAEAYNRWGKGIHPAGLNFGDCFAYELAKEQACPLLFVGDDFSKTDVTRAL